MPNWFHDGGFAMWPTLLLGVLTVSASVRYAGDPQRRFIPLIVSLGITTLLSGAVGFVTGVIKSLGALPEVGPDERWIWMVGLGESLVNIAFALGLVGLAALGTVFGAWRLARD